MPKMPKHPFFDRFFFGVVAFVAFLSFVDFLLGKTGREKIKELVGNWWVYLEDTTFAGLGAADAAWIRSWFEKRLGPILSFRFWVRAWLGASVLLVVALFGLSSLIDESDKSLVAAAVERLVTAIAILADSGVILFLANTFVPVISLAVTQALLRLMAATNSLLLLFLLTIGDILAVLAIIVLTVIIVQSHRTIDPFNFGNVFDQMIWMSGGLVSLLPIVLHTLLVTLFIVSKLTLPVFKKPVNLVLLRIYESDKGVLTLVGVALGALAKLCQEGIKLI